MSTPGLELNVLRPAQIAPVRPAPAADPLLCAATARWLQACGSALGALGLVCTLIAAGLLASRLPWPGLAGLALALVLPERLLALRTGFDAGLFAELARASAAGMATAASLQGLDKALQRLQLRAAPSASAALRPLAHRVLGARRLSLQHAGVVLLQFGAVALQLVLAAGRTA